MDAPLDDAVYAASKELRGRGAPDPDVLCLLATGVEILPDAYRPVWRGPLEAVAGVPRAWRGGTLIAAEAKGGTFWFLDDAPGDQEDGGAVLPDDPPWTRGFPCWLAACSGASLCVHSSAGVALPREDGERYAERLVIARDHVNLSGRNPLLGLGSTRLGPAFPDQTRVHHPGLRHIARRHVERMGVGTAEVIVACSPGPSLLTPAERVFYARAGAEVAVQGLADPLVALSHAGLACLALIAVTDASLEPELTAVVEASDRLAPALSDLLDALAPDLSTVADELREEVG